MATGPISYRVTEAHSLEVPWFYCSARSVLSAFSAHTQPSLVLPANSHLSS